MSTTAKTTPATKPSALKIVPPVETDTLANALEQFATEQRPMIRRGEIARQKLAQQVRETETLLVELDGREALLDRVYEAAKAAMADQRNDLNEELALYTRGLEGSASGRAD
ncbi:hypothetical protein GCM10007913_11500 [Devosia yakushimensis]|uniref:Uncharacterized protein n=1 Tax=Devosia yakushimensis TaxID=470028 RepID=A0ABQ5UB80_9HYPH|nr:hypothetical protein [Devosia yakushimensis]GLQ09218.1 hypothetical protein GCM10007913_11500 [Devosia yakushimensis]